MFSLIGLFVCISILILHCHGQPVFDCPLPVAYGDSANLTCSKVNQGSGSIKNPASEQVVLCTPGSCTQYLERINASIANDLILLTVQRVHEADDGEWLCESGSDRATCSLSIYKLPSCVISSTTSTNNLTIGQDLTLNINLSDYYCTNSITWNFKIGGKHQNITEFHGPVETENITDSLVTYSTTVTSSLTGRVALTFNCNDEKHNVNCNEVEELKLREPPSCNLTSKNDTGDLTIGYNLTLEAAIEEYPCGTGIEYSLLIRSVMETEFIRRNSLFYATFIVKSDYLHEKLMLKYTCNNVSSITSTSGVEKLLTKDYQKTSSYKLGHIIGPAVGGFAIIIIITVIIWWNKRKKKSRTNDAPYSDVRDSIPGRKCSLKVTCNDTYTEVSDITGSLKRNHFECNDGQNRNYVENIFVKGNQNELIEFSNGRERNFSDKSRPRSECVMVPNVAYESVDEIMQLKAKENGKLLIGTGDDYAEGHKRRSRDIGGHVVLASAHV